MKWPKLCIGKQNRGSQSLRRSSASVRDFFFFEIWHIKSQETLLFSESDVFSVELFLKTYSQMLENVFENMFTNV